MPNSVKKVIREEYNRLKKVMERLIKPNKEQGFPSLIPIPVRNKTR
jgi:hypothetical protein